LPRFAANEPGGKTMLKFLDQIDPMTLRDETC
jgi:hypothetical protein